METNQDVEFPQNQIEAYKYFSDPRNSHAFAALLRWPDGVTCPRCGGKQFYFIRADWRWHCKSCKKRFTVRTGTIMHNSPLKLEIWMAATWEITSCKNGISSCELSRKLGITQKSAWHLLHRIRRVMQADSGELLDGPVEVDETFIGGKEANKHSDKKLREGRGAVGKEIVLGILERGNEIRAKVIPDTGKETLHAEIKDNVKPGSELYTDAHKGYRGLSEEFKHEWVDHATKYAEGKIHNNGVENFWSLFDRMLGGTYTQIDPRHLQAYLDEMARRFNTRRETDGGRFAMTVASFLGKRLTYQELTERGLTTIAPKKKEKEESA